MEKPPWWDGRNQQQHEAPRRPRHPDFPPPVPPTVRRRIRPALIATTVVSTLSAAVGLYLCGVAASHNTACDFAVVGFAGR